MIVKYVSASGESICLNGDGIKLRKTDFYRHKWEEEEISGKYKFSRKPRTYRTLVEVTGERSYKTKKLNDMHRITENDTLSGKEGRLYYGDQYLICNICEATSEPAESPIGVMKEIIFFSKDPVWIKETHYDFYASDIYNGSSKKYAYRYPYRYGGGLTGDYIINEHFDKVDFKMVIFGPVINPLVIIGGHKYQINILLETGEYLELDTEKGTVIKVMNSGQVVNAFHNREKSSDPFAPIIPGRHTVEWTGKFDWNITMYAKRSEPEWQ